MLGGPLAARPFSRSLPLTMTLYRRLSHSMNATLVASFMLSGSQLLAEPGDTDTSAGSAEARIVDPIDIQRVADLRFGRIIRPTTAGTLRVDPDTTVTTTGGVTGNESTPQETNGRGPAAFALFGEPNRRFNASTTGNTTLAITVTNGTATMSVKQFRDNTGSGFSQLNSSGYYALFVGARLDVGANQQAGTYKGTFDVTVRYN